MWKMVLELELKSAGIRVKILKFSNFQISRIQIPNLHSNTAFLLEYIFATNLQTTF